MTSAQGWAALTRRDLDAAFTHFSQALHHDPQDIGALCGVARAHLLRGELDHAEQILQRAQQITPSHEAAILLAAIYGERGHRAEAAKRLQELLPHLPQNALVRAVLAEQRIRQGFWSDGTALFIDGLQLDHDGQAFMHFREVISDMSDAVHAGKLPNQEPIKMLNRISASISKEHSAFLARARRALESHQPIDRSPTRHEPSASAPEQPEQRTTSTPARASSAPSRSSKRPRSASSTPAATGSSYGDELSRIARASHRGFKPSEFMQSMQQERDLNEQLQQGLEPLPSSQWPSALVDKLDQLPPVESAYHSVTDQLAEYRQRSFRVTQGDIATQLYMERCLAALMDRIPSELTGPLIIHPTLFAYLDLNLLDGLLERPLHVVTHDLGEGIKANPTDVAKSAFSYFLGEGLVRAYHGAWAFHDTVKTCSVHIAGSTITPYPLVERWLDDPAHDPQEIYETLEQATRFAQENMLAKQTTYEHIDLTAGMSGESLTLKLAELWSLYCFRLARSSSVEIAKHLKVLQQSEELIVFEVDQAYSPSPPGLLVGQGALQPDSKRVVHGYRRRTGEFLMLCRAACMARVLEDQIGPLSEANAPQALQQLKQYFLPGALLVERDDQGARLSDQIEIKGPRFRHLQRSSEIVFWLVANRQATPWKLRMERGGVQPDAPFLWELERAS